MPWGPSAGPSITSCAQDHTDRIGPQRTHPQGGLVERRPGQGQLGNTAAPSARWPGQCRGRPVSARAQGWPPSSRNGRGAGPAVKGAPYGRVGSADSAVAPPLTPAPSPLCGLWEGGPGEAAGSASGGASVSLPGADRLWLRGARGGWVVRHRLSGCGRWGPRVRTKAGWVVAPRLSGCGLVGPGRERRVGSDARPGGHRPVGQEGTSGAGGIRSRSEVRLWDTKSRAKGATWCPKVSSYSRLGWDGMGPPSAPQPSPNPRSGPPGRSGPPARSSAGPPAWPSLSLARRVRVRVRPTANQPPSRGGTTHPLMRPNNQSAPGSETRAPPPPAPLPCFLGRPVYLALAGPGRVSRVERQRNRRSRRDQRERP